MYSWMLRTCGCRLWYFFGTEDFLSCCACEVAVWAKYSTAVRKSAALYSPWRMQKSSPLPMVYHALIGFHNRQDGPHLIRSITRFLFPNPVKESSRPFTVREFTQNFFLHLPCPESPASLRIGNTHKIPFSG